MKTSMVDSTDIEANLEKYPACKLLSALSRMTVSTVTQSVFATCVFLAVALQSHPAAAHSSNQSFVLLLPTDFYITSGVAAVAITVLLLALPQTGRVLASFPKRAIWKIGSQETPSILATVTSLLSLALLVFLLYTGVFGSRDPLVNLLPLTIWTIWWVFIVVVQALIGNLWLWINPWTGLYAALGFEEPVFELPRWLQIWPGILGFFAFLSFMLAHAAPEDPYILALYVGGYWLVTFIGMVLFGGEIWLSRCECFTIMMRYFSQTAIFGTYRSKVHAGVPGWQIVASTAPKPLGAAFILIMLGSSSFDGLNETFWWLVVLDINPLEFPGRSGIIWQTIGGIITSNIVLLVVFAACIAISLRIIDTKSGFVSGFCSFAPTVLPIAVAYHIAHFLPSFLVNAQYALAAISDPLTNGADLLGLGTFYITTGFFNSKDTVRIIFLTQVFAVVAGHILSILAAHNVATRLYGNNKHAVMSQIPLASFMVAYTFFGLWLLAAPRGA